MKILILGNEGQIGKPLANYLYAQGHTITGWDKVNGPLEDLTDYENLYQLNYDLDWADKVIFLAFEVGGSKYLTNVDKSFNYIHENVMIMGNVFEKLKTSGKPFLFASSQMANMHHTNYGFLKDLGERYTRSLGTNGWICRFWNVYGVETCSEEKTHVITDLIKKASTGTINLISTGEEARQFLHVDDCNIAIEQWVDGIWDNHSKYYDITSFEWTSIKEVANLISELTHVDGIGHPKVTCGSQEDTIQKNIKNPPSNYIRNFWSPKISLEEGIDKVMQAFYNVKI